jgi:4-amino-4-deoxy-L-arabinose transferase-like glycosyltransferase
VLNLIRQYKWSFLVATAAGIALRMLFILKFQNINGDSLIYADIATNWLNHGTFALTEMGVPVPTLIRLPGYPAVIAVLFTLFHTTDLTPVLYAQMLVDLGTCFVVAALALELFSARVARVAFAVAALCPFTANYAALPLTETLAIFFTAVALLLAAKAARLNEQKYWAGCGLAIGAGILLRPDGVLLLFALMIFLVWRFLVEPERKRFVVAALIVGVVSVAPLVPWTIRNWNVFHVIQPLAPRYANAPSEYVPMGFNHWVKTWMAEYVSVEDVFWKVSTETPGEAIEFEKIPPRAFDSDEERERTEKLIAELNQTLMLTPETDAKFAELARERMRRAPLRYYVWLPTLRITDMWLRPRTEMLPIEPRWWEFDDEQESAIAIGLGTLNLMLLLAAIVGFVKFRNIRIYGLLLGFVLLRSVFLASIENPEPRYTLECFPVILVMAAAAIQYGWESFRRRRHTRA